MFKYRKSNLSNSVPEILQVPATADEAFVVGEALKLSSGKATKCSGTTKPEYICAEKKTAKSGDTISAQLVANDQEYEVALPDSATLVVGTKYTIGTDGASVTSTSTSGVAEVVAVNGAKVVVRF